MWKAVIALGGGIEHVARAGGDDEQVDGGFAKSDAVPCKAAISRLVDSAGARWLTGRVRIHAVVIDARVQGGGRRRIDGERPDTSLKVIEEISDIVPGGSAVVRF